MGLIFSREKKKPSTSRKIPLLPRVGVYVDFAGYEYIFKHVPLLETILNMPNNRLSYALIQKITKEQFSEVNFPKKIKAKIFNTTATVISSKKI